MRRFVGLSLALVVILATAVTAQTKAASKPGGKAAEGGPRGSSAARRSIQ